MCARYNYLCNYWGVNERAAVKLRELATLAFLLSQTQRRDVNAIVRACEWMSVRDAMRASDTALFYAELTPVRKIRIQGRVVLNPLAHLRQFYFDDMREKKVWFLSKTRKE